MSKTEFTRRPLARDDPRHGTRNAYGNLGCRCGPCREANTIYCRESRDRMKQPRVTVSQPWVLPGEEWKDIPGYEGLYQASNLGRVRGLDRDRPHSNGKGTVPVARKVLNPFTDRNGYRLVVLSRAGIHRRVGIHILVLESFVGPRPKNFDACHNNGVAGDDGLENLRWDTKSSKTLDTVKHGTHPQARKTHCKWGHEFTPENTSPHGNWETGRRCKTCDTLKGQGSGLGRGYRNKSKTHCKRGHEFTAENTILKTTGRECRACRPIHANNRALRIKQEAGQ